MSSELTGLVNYDDRLAAAAEAAGSQSSARTTELCAVSSRLGGLAAEETLSACAMVRRSRSGSLIAGLRRCSVEAARERQSRVGVVADTA